MENDKDFIQHIKNLKALGASAVKLELESEYLSFSLCKKISDILNKNSLDLILKPGGFSSYNDIQISKDINAKIIVAPMIESPYALQKFVSTLSSVYSADDLSKKDIFINIETISAIKNLDDILKSDYFKLIKGVVIGRGDLCLSLNMPLSLINSDDMYKIIFPVVDKCLAVNKKIILGGNITLNSIDFLKKFPTDTLFGFETRKIFFKSDLIQNQNLSALIKKAIEFEIYYLQLLLVSSNQPENIRINIQKRVNLLNNRLN